MKFLPTRNKRLNLLIWLKTFGLGPVAMTCTGKTDGGGAQVHAILSVKAFCKAFGFTYLHTPFSVIEHTSGPDEVTRWEETFALGQGHDMAAHANLQIIPLKIYSKTPKLWFRPVIVALPHAHDYTDHVDDAFEGLQKKHLPRAADQPLQIAVHLRRGDVSATQNTDRYTPDEKILSLIEQLTQALRNLNRPFEFHIYSQGSPENFSAYEQLGCHVHLNQDALNDLLALSQADILVIAKSSFSYVAGLLNPGLVIYEPFWHRPQNTWAAINDAQKIPDRIKQ